MGNIRSTANKAMRTVLLLLIVLPCLAVLAITLLSGMNNARVLKTQAQQLLANRTSESADYTRSFLQTVENQLISTHRLFSQGLLNQDEIDEQISYVITQLELHPVISGMYTSNLEGDFFYVSRSIEADKGKYRIKIIERDFDSVQIKMWWQNPDDSKRYDFTEMDDDGFDARQRPWFIQATNKKETIWTDPYIFFTTQKLGITVATPFLNNENVIGALGIDVELTGLSEFLYKLDETRFGSSFIVTEKGTFIADSQLDNSSSIDNLSLVSVAETSNQLIKKAYAVVLNGDDDSFDYLDQQYLVEATSLDLNQSVPWYIVSYAEKDSFLQPITHNNRRNYWLAGLVSLGTILLGWLFAKNLSRPVHDLEDRANRDQLTGLHNRAFLNTNVQQWINFATDKGSELTFAIIDLDFFKQVNDTLGHDFGDMVLKIFSKRMQNHLRDSDIFIRLGGEEFLVVMPNTDSATAKKVLHERNVEISQQPIRYGEEETKITFSAGIVQLSDHYSSFATIYKAADEALYKAKREGRNRIVVVLNTHN